MNWKLNVAHVLFENLTPDSVSLLKAWKDTVLTLLLLMETSFPTVLISRQ